MAAYIAGAAVLGSAIFGAIGQSEQNKQSQKAVDVKYKYDKNPLNKNFSVGKPDNSNELIIEEGPGITVNGIAFLIHF